MDYNIDTLNQVLYVKKDSFKNDSTQIMLSNPNVNSLIIDNFCDNCIIDFNKSTNIFIDSILKSVKISDGFTSGELITNEIKSISETIYLQNLTCKIYSILPAGSKLEYYILSNGSEYPISSIVSNTNNYLNIPALNLFRLKVKIIRSEQAKSPIIETLSIFYKDLSIS